MQEVTPDPPTTPPLKKTKKVNENKRQQLKKKDKQEAAVGILSELDGIRRGIIKLDSSTEALARVQGRTGDRRAVARPIGRNLKFPDQRLVHPVQNDAECPF